MSINSINGNTLLTSGSFPPVRVASAGSPLNPATGGLLVVTGVVIFFGLFTQFNNWMLQAFPGLQSIG